MVQNEDITVLNRKGDKYEGAVYKGCSLIGKSEKSVSEHGLMSADYFILRIPKSSLNGKIPVIEPQKTLVAIGSVSEVSSVTEFIKTHKVYTAVSFKNNLVGVEQLQHIRVDLK